MVSWESDFTEEEALPPIPGTFSISLYYSHLSLALGLLSNEVTHTTSLRLLVCFMHRG
jgi:hypothetical protein